MHVGTILNAVHKESLVRTKFRRFKGEQNGCYLCWKNFTDEELTFHLNLHLTRVVLKDFNASWKSMGNEPSLACSVGLIAGNLIFEIENKTDDEVIIQFIGVYNDILKFGRLNPTAFPLTIQPGNKVTLKSPIAGLSSHNHYIITYEEGSKRNFEKIESYFIELKLDQIRINSVDGDVSTVAEVERPDAEPTTESAVGIIGAKRILDILKIKHLPWYEPCDFVKELCFFCFKSASPKLQPHLPLNPVLQLFNQFRELTPLNYVEILSKTVEIEDFTARLAIKASTKHNRKLLRIGSAEYMLKLSESEGRPLFLTKGDTLYIGHDDFPNCRMYGCVKRVTSEEIVIKLRNNTILESHACYSIHFEVNRLTFQMERKALEEARYLNIISILFPATIEKTADGEVIPTNATNIEEPLPKLKYFDVKVKSDTNQMEAIQHIVAGTAYPLPYLLVGYPGTGKTKVIVESICQLFTYPKNRILVCASSNTVCDEIAQKLIPLLSRTSQYQTPITQQYNILRLYATSVRRSCKGHELLENSNFDEKSIPCLAEIYKYRIVVCTLTVSGRLAQGDIDKTHFTHLFIDECESAAETYTMIPIAGVCSSLNKINAHVVLSGDPQQLGPIVRSSIIKNYSLSVSMFLRLYSHEAYRINKKTNTYNRRLIAKLKNNYRSHPQLVEMPNRLFYNHEMRCSANVAQFKWLCELDFLPRRGFPILFEHIEGCPERKENCLSWFNEAEVQSVMYYVRELLNNKSRQVKQSDIGVISPYKRQCINIEECLEAEGLLDVEVGSVEQFQGKEKPIIIISTVRKGTIGFVNDRERINVMLTRAIGLLIIIGHKKSLYQTRAWRKVIEYTIAKCDGEVLVEYFPEEADNDDRC